MQSDAPLFFMIADIIVIMVKVVSTSNAPKTPPIIASAAVVVSAE